MPRRAKRKEKKDRAVGITLMFVGVLLIGTLGGGAWWLNRTRVQLDAENCPIKGPSAITLVMIDRSDPVSPQQAQRIRQYIQQRKDDAKFGARFDIYVFEGDAKNELQPVFRVCAPGKPDDANELIENPQTVRRKYNETFSSALDNAINGLLRATTKPNSPIIESIRAAAITSFGTTSSSDISLRMILISDMVQHTASVSQFRSALEFSTLSKSPVWPTLRPELHGAQVDILYVLRPEATRGGVPIQTRGHQLFWEQLISASNGHLAAFTTL